MDGLSKERRSANMRAIRSVDTSPELAVRRLVHGMGFRYRLHVRSLPGTPDLVFPRLNRIIEIKGCFWHQHEGCIDSHIPKTRPEYWVPKLARNRNRDAQNQRQLRSLGWAVLILWECEIAAGTRLKKRIQRFLGSPANGHVP